MYQALIVEDEPLMRGYLAEHLTQIHPDWQVSAIAKDGIEAMEVLQRCFFDLVITDIRMPGMDGLGIAQYVERNFPQTCVVIVSGYEAFQYARTAVRLNVCDYLLKPLNDQELHDTLERVSQKIARRLAQGREDAGFPALFLSMLQKDHAAFKAACTKFCTLPNMMGAASHGLLLCAPDPVPAIQKEGAAALHSLQRKLYETAFSHFEGMAAMDESGNTAIWLPSADPFLSQILCQQAFTRLTSAFSHVCGLPILGGYSCRHEGIAALPEAYEAAANALILCRAGNAAPVSGELLFSQRMRLTEILSLTKQVCESANQERGPELTEKTLRFARLLPQDSRQQDALALGCLLIDQMKMAKEPAAQALIHLFSRVGPSPLPSEDVARIYGECLTLGAGNQRVNQSKVAPLIEEVREYLCAHFREGLSLSMVADRFHVTPAYLSALFHKEAGVSYSKYLLRLRMEEAALCLRTDPAVKVYDVARKVGFVSSQHFIGVFKKYYGLPPREYQEQA